MHHSTVQDITKNYITLQYTTGRYNYNYATLPNTTATITVHYIQAYAKQATLHYTTLILQHDRTLHYTTIHYMTLHTLGTLKTTSSTNTANSTTVKTVKTTRHVTTLIPLRYANRITLH